MQTVQTIRKSKEYFRKRAELLEAQLDPGIIAKLDKDGNGVDRLEFVVGMLTTLGVVQMNDVQTFLDRFDQVCTRSVPALSPPCNCSAPALQLDADGSGHLDHKDLAHMLEQNAAEAARSVAHMLEENGKEALAFSEVQPALTQAAAKAGTVGCPWLVARCGAGAFGHAPRRA